MRGRAPKRFPCRVSSDEGQSSVELALALPFVFGLLLALIQAGLFVRDQVMLTHTAREAARTAAVTPDAEQVQGVARRASPLDPNLLVVTQAGRGLPGSLVTVRVDYESPVRVPILGVAWRSRHLTSEATMRVER